MDPKHAAVPLSQIEATPRLDAGYHIALTRAALHMPLFADLPADEAVSKANQMVEAAPKEVLISALGPLATGSHAAPSMSIAQARVVVVAHPHLSLALLHKYLPEIISHQRDLCKHAQQAMNTMLDLSSDYPPPTRPIPSSRRPGP